MHHPTIFLPILALFILKLLRMYIQYTLQSSQTEEHRLEATNDSELNSRAYISPQDRERIYEILQCIVSDAEK